MGKTSLIPMLLNSLWQALVTFTGFAGLTPVDLGLGILGLIAVVFLFLIVQALRNKSHFSVNPKDTKW